MLNPAKPRPGANRQAAPAQPEFVYKVHPSIGIARVGNAPYDEFFVGPEIPGVLRTQVNLPNGKTAMEGPPLYKNSKGQIRPQAARFRVYEYKLGEDGVYRVTREVSAANGCRVEWIVEVKGKV